MRQRLASASQRSYHVFMCRCTGSSMDTERSTTVVCYSFCNWLLGAVSLVFASALTSGTGTYFTSQVLSFPRSAGSAVDPRFHVSFDRWPNKVVDPDCGKQVSAKTLEHCHGSIAQSKIRKAKPPKNVSREHPYPRGRRPKG